jgi:hypothetical protein
VISRLSGGQSSSFDPGVLADWEEGDDEDERDVEDEGDEDDDDEEEEEVEDDDDVVDVEDVLDKVELLECVDELEVVVRLVSVAVGVTNTKLVEKTVTTAMPEGRVVVTFTSRKMVLMETVGFYGAGDVYTKYPRRKEYVMNLR